MGALRFSIAILLALVVLEVGCASAAAVPREGEEKQAFSLREVLDGSFRASGLGAVWITGKDLARLTGDNIRKEDVSIEEEEGDQEILVESSTLDKLDGTIGSWVFSKDNKKLLCSYDVKAGFRHSTEAKYSVLKLEENPDKVWTSIGGSEHLQTALLSPENNGVAYVFKNDLYYIGDIESLEPQIRRITEDGDDGLIYNGVPDWVYEEEVLSSGSALWFSPGGSYLAFGKFDDTDVKEFRYITYGEDQYTNVETLLYPKTGSKNPIATINIVDLSNAESKPVSFDVDFNEGDDRYPILQNVAWISDVKLLVVWLNRIQNKILIYSYIYSTPEGATEGEWTPNKEFEDSQVGGWYQVSTPRAVSETDWVQLLPRSVGATTANDGDSYLVPVLFKDGVEGPKNIVNEEITATALYGWDTVNNLGFYQAAPAGQPGQRHVYSVKEDEEPKCLSCDFKQPHDEADCLYASASFSTDFSYAAITCSGPGPAAVGLIKINADGSGEWKKYLEKNENLNTKLGERLLPTIVPTTISVAEGYTAQVRLWLPPNLDETKKYPMLVYVYGGPGAQQVSEAFSVSWGYYLTTSKNIIYASIDGRGSGYQGNKNLFAIYKKLGTLEVTDQIDVTRKLLEEYSYIDKDRVGIWGWSYGGYATAMALSLDEDHVFACGASVAPVTSWELYDTIYTERYMDMPGANADGYREASVGKNTENFETHQFYLLHGNADDNVHYQQSMRLARVLEENNVYFEQQSYPDENHSISSVVTHVYISLGVFFDRCFVANEEVTTSAAGHLWPALLTVLIFPLFSLLFV